MPGKRPPIHVPPGFPVFARGFCMGYLGRVLALHVAEADDESVERYVVELARSIDARREGDELLVLYDVPKLSEFTAKQRKRIAEVVDARRRKLEATTKKMVLATGSPFVRGVLQAIWWLTPPPYPYAFAKDAREAIAILCRDDGELDQGEIEREYGALLTAWRARRGSPA